MNTTPPLPPLVGFPKRVVEAGGIASVGGYSRGIHREAILPAHADPVLVKELRAEGWHVVVVPGRQVLR